MTNSTLLFQIVGLDHIDIWSTSNSIRLTLCSRISAVMSLDPPVLFTWDFQTKSLIRDVRSILMSTEEAAVQVVEIWIESNGERSSRLLGEVL